MKKAALFLVGIFPYCLLFEGVLMRVGVIELPLSIYNTPLMIAIPAVAYVFARLGLVYLLKMADRAEFVKFNLLLNIAQIPAHLFNILVCIAFVLTLFGIILAPYFIAVTAFALDLTGRIGRTAVQWCREKGLLTQEEAVRESNRQPIFGVAVLSAITLYQKTKEVSL